MKTEKDLKGKTFIHSCACMSVTSDALSWANDDNQVTTDQDQADNIVVLGCQVTDLAVLNDLKVLERMRSKYPDKKLYVGGCLSQREDIDLDFERIDPLRSDYTIIEDRSLVSVEPPFWVKDFKEDGESNLKSGNIFRNHYPLRIGVGCSGKCKFCTIKHTRAGSYVLATPKLEEEMKWANDKGFQILLIADSPQTEQLNNLMKYALSNKIHLSFRNVEPAVLCKLFKSEILRDFIRTGLMDYFHAPIQSLNEKILSDMSRSVPKTAEAFEILYWMKSEGVKVATNIIIDYKGMLDSSLEICKVNLDYVSWNPLWDGKWNREESEKRFEHYSNKFETQ